MKRSSLALLICLVFACVSYAQQDPQDQPASKEDIQRYMDAMNVREITTNMMQRMKPAMHKMFEDQIKGEPNVTPEMIAQIEKMMDNSIDSVKMNEFLDAMTPIYEKYLTKGDVDALIAFYSTPRGQKILKEMPAMTADAMAASSGVMKKVMMSMQGQMRTQLGEMQKQNRSKAEQN